MVSGCTPLPTAMRFLMKICLTCLRLINKCVDLRWDLRVFYVVAISAVAQHGGMDPILCKLSLLYHKDMDRVLLKL